MQITLGALGYHAHRVPGLIVVKSLGLIAILSRVNVFLSDFAFAGMFFHLLLVFSAHLNGAGYAGAVPPRSDLSRLFRHC